LIHCGENLIQPVVVLLQRFSQHCEPLVHGFNAGLCQTTGTRGAVHAPRDQARILKDFQMLGDCGLRHLEGLRQFHHIGFALGEPREDCPARWIGQSGESGVEI